MSLDSKSLASELAVLVYSLASDRNPPITYKGGQGEVNEMRHPLLIGDWLSAERSDWRISILTFAINSVFAGKINLISD